MSFTSISTGLQHLPHELLLGIADNLDTKSIGRLSQTCIVIHGPLKKYLQGVVARREALPPQRYYDETFRKLPSGEYEVIETWMANPPDQHMAWAVHWGRVDIIKLYLHAGVNPNSYTLYGNSMLSHTVSESQVESARILLRYGANPCLPNLCGGSVPLDLAVDIQCPPGGFLYAQNRKMIALLISKGAKIPSFMAFKYICSISTCPAVLVKRALRSGTEFLEFRGDVGDTVLHIAVQIGKDLTAVILEAAPALLDKRDSNGRTALHVATDSGCVSAMKYLTQKKCAINSSDSVDDTALHIAATRSLDRVQLVASHLGVDMNALNRTAESLLSVAISYYTNCRDYFGIVDFFLRDDRTYIDPMSVVEIKHLLIRSAKSIYFWMSDLNLIVRFFWLYAKQSARLSGSGKTDGLVFPLFYPFLFYVVYCLLVFWAFAIGTNSLVL
ncbi:hypothetical protein BBP40_001350 [Aspergillus hancockii]|nr:hypothetical protein BBP40_001350 [Aspergillus hancockii]